MLGVKPLKSFGFIPKFPNVATDDFDCVLLVVPVLLFEFELPFELLFELLPESLLELLLSVVLAVTATLVDAPASTYAPFNTALELSVVFITIVPSFVHL